MAAIAIQDRVFLNGIKDAVYGARRRGAFVVAVNCTEPGGTCFCASMGTGPGATAGFDIALTEVLDGKDHYFTAEAGSDRGAEVLAAAGAAEAKAGPGRRRPEKLVEAAGRARWAARSTPPASRNCCRPTRTIPQWEAVAKRCLTCANCTLVCPTCFCANVEDLTDLSGAQATRTRRWDSCFNFEFSYMHGGPLRPSAAARYRQWMTHKLASWYDQFGTSGCVGCGRCITWCPVGIDITAEAAAIRSSKEVVGA